MKVFYIDPQSYNNLSVYDYSLLSNVQGHQVTYYYSDFYQLDHLPGHQNKCIFHYSQKPGSLLKAVSYTWSILRILCDALLRRPDVIHVQWLRLWQVDYLFAWLMVRLGVRVIFTAHNILPHVAKPSDEGQYRRYYHLVNDIIVHNARTRDELVAQMCVKPEKVHVIFHGIMDSSIPRSDVEERSQQLQEQLGIHPGDLVFSCLGVQKPYKGTDLAVQVWAETPEFSENPHCHLLIIGRNHGIDYSPVSRLENVFILDEMISDLDFEAYLQLSSVVLLPYKKISQSGLLFSAINRHTPSLVSDVGGLTEPLQYGRVGWSMGAPTVENLQRFMLRLIDNPEEIWEYKRATEDYEHIRQIYSWPAIGEKTSELYEARA